ncbi:DUF4386 family protein [Agromyces protaetiae]|uniref:DUF4386 family protein n=1 Tax=Agromyces protaetiae TaxID=2509455 RepID=A0A4P6FNH9_9MICO|nr:DUF4386 family protein [Agromyces protaetiae]QAY72048.1 DUF4386 family protein [Agromyces protaetiae]
MNKTTTLKGTTLTGILLIASAVVVNVAFTVLGTAFDYPDILQRPSDEVLGRFAANPVVIGGTFALLAAGAAMLAPIALRLNRHFPAGRIGTAAAITGVAAAAVQVLGLLRWPLIVPFLANALPGSSGTEREALLSTFSTLNSVLGQTIGETFGYLLTTAWTVLAVIALRRAGVIGRLTGILGFVSAALIVTGVLVPLDVPFADQANFVGYILWSAWLVILGITAIVRGRRAKAADVSSATRATAPLVGA